MIASFSEVVKLFRFTTWAAFSPAGMFCRLSKGLSPKRQSLGAVLALLFVGPGESTLHALLVLALNISDLGPPRERRESDVKNRLV